MSYTVFTVPLQSLIERRISAKTSSVAVDKEKEKEQKLVSWTATNLIMVCK